MTLAGKISSTAMQIIAVQKLGFGISEVETLEAATRENQWMMKFKLLDRWKNRNRRNSRQVRAFHCHFYCHKQSLGQDNVFTCVCHSVHGGMSSQHALGKEGSASGGSALGGWQTSLPRETWETTGYGQ